MNDKTKDLNHVINMMYRQLGKDLYDDLGQDKLNIKKYKKLTKRIDNLIKLIGDLETSMDPSEDDADMKVIKAPEQDHEGLFHYKFCQGCNAGNNPQATHCIRCGEKL